MDMQGMIAKLEAKIQDEHKKWEELDKQITQQYAAERGAYAGRVNLLTEQVEELKKELGLVSEPGNEQGFVDAESTVM